MAAEPSASARRDAAGRLIAELDRHGTLLTELDWQTDGRLARAAVRIPDRSWVTIHPGAGAPGPWGRSDELRQGAAVVTGFGALEWSRITHIPPLAEPVRLPPGAGTAVLNVIARLAAEQGATALRYEAPYPTEQLFLALLESFHWSGSEVADPLRAFMGGALTWTPAPHTRAFEGERVYVQRRERIEKICVDGRAFYRPDWQGVGRRTPRIVRDSAGTVRASLLALGTVLEDAAVLAPDGSVRDLPPPVADPTAVDPFPADLVNGLVATVVAASAPALGPSLRQVAAELHFEWGPVAAELVAFDATRMRLSPKLRRAMSAAVARSEASLQRVGIAFAALGELADLVGDELRRRAQATLERAPDTVQAAALEESVVAKEGDATAIGRAVEALLTAAQLA